MLDGFSFHGGLGGPQTRPFILYPVGLDAPDGPIVGAEAVHGILTGWRRSLQGGEARGKQPVSPVSPLPQNHL